MTPPATDATADCGTPSQQELDSKLLAAANALRRPVDAADFKGYVFPLLKLKRTSDTWEHEHEHEHALAIFAGDDQLARLPDNFRFIVPPGCLWDDVLALHENIGDYSARSCASLLRSTGKVGGRNDAGKVRNECRSSNALR